MRRKCFTLVELLVVIGIIAVLLGILLPALSAVKRTAQRVVCASNLAAIGKAIMLYANEFDGDYPRAGGAEREWADNGRIADWCIQDGSHYGRSGAKVTISSSLYLLIKWEDGTPAEFVCRGDAGTAEFKLSDAPQLAITVADDVTDVWDFGGGPLANTKTTYWPGQYNSYSYHCPYVHPTMTDARAFPLGSYSSPESPVCADRNPYLDKNSVVFLEGIDCSGDAQEVKPTWDATEKAYLDNDKTGNTAAHAREGQNVLYNDSHVRFERFPNVGISNDNIWKSWQNFTIPDAQERQGVSTNMSPYCSTLKEDGDIGPWAEIDAVLVSERNSR